jgi:hypothetical protein
MASFAARPEGRDGAAAKRRRRVLNRVLPLLVFSAVGLAACRDTPVDAGDTPEATEPLFALAGPAGFVDAGSNHTCAIGADGQVSRLPRRRAAAAS